MRKRDAARLRPGERVLVCDDEFWPAESATVVHATERGGVLVREGDGRERWHPYSEVFFPEG